MNAQLVPDFDSSARAQFVADWLAESGGGSYSGELAVDCLLTSGSSGTASGMSSLTLQNSLQTLDGGAVGALSDLDLILWSSLLTETLRNILAELSISFTAGSLQNASAETRTTMPFYTVLSAIQASAGNYAVWTQIPGSFSTALSGKSSEKGAVSQTIVLQSTSLGYAVSSGILQQAILLALLQTTGAFVSETALLSTSFSIASFSRIDYNSTLSLIELLQAAASSAAQSIGSVNTTETLSTTASGIRNIHAAAQLSQWMQAACDAAGTIVTTLAVTMAHAVQSSTGMVVQVSVDIPGSFLTALSGTPLFNASTTLVQQLGVAILSNAATLAGFSVNSVTKFSISGNIMTATLKLPKKRTLKISIDLRNLSTRPAKERRILDA